MKHLKKPKKGMIFEPRKRYSHIPDKNKLYDCIIIGSGAAGYSAAMYSARLGMKTLIVGEVPGGTIALTGTVENYPGFVSIDGQMLAQLLENHAMDYDIDMVTDIVENINYGNSEKIFTVSLEKKSFRSKTIILATGADVKKLGVRGEDEFFGKGVSYCALCDATSIKGKIVAVAGGGDSAVKEAALLAEYARKVYIINNEKDVHPEFSNSMLLKEMVRKGKIEVISGIEITEIKGRKRIESVVLSRKYKGKEELALGGLFIYIGRLPKSELAKMLGVKLNDTGEVIVNSNSETNVPGLFAAGDVTNTEWKQAIIGVAQGVSAAYHAYKFIKNLGGVSDE